MSASDEPRVSIELTRTQWERVVGWLDSSNGDDGQDLAWAIRNQLPVAYGLGAVISFLWPGAEGNETVVLVYADPASRVPWWRVTTPDGGGIWWAVENDKRMIPPNPDIISMGVQTWDA